MSILTKTDGYCISHHRMYPKDTQYVYSYFESRIGAKFPNVPFFGLHYILKKYLLERPTWADLRKARYKMGLYFGQFTKDSISKYDNQTRNKYDYDYDKFYAESGQKEIFPNEGWSHIIREHNGKLPVRIKAAPEGLIIPTGNVMYTVENTDPRCYWLTNYLQTILTQVWYPSTVCALSRHVKTFMERYAIESASSLDYLKFALHDFGMRGVSSNESAAIGGLAHLVNFLGSDTLEALDCGYDYYDADFEGLAYSVPASEHALGCALGQEGEEQVVQNLINEFPTGILSVVGDGFDIYNFVDNIVGKKFKDQILGRNGTFVIRPDSNTARHPRPEDQVLWILDSLWKNFSGPINKKGYKVLDPHVRVLWGDGLSADGINEVLSLAVSSGYSAENLVFGMGGGLLQKLNRDTNRLAYKSSAQCRNGIWHDVFKNPLDPSKASKKGKLKLVKNGDSYTTVPLDIETDNPNLLQTVYENGEILISPTFAEIRKRASL